MDMRGEDAPDEVELLGRRLRPGVGLPRRRGSVVVGHGSPSVVFHISNSEGCNRWEAWPLLLQYSNTATVRGR